MSEMTKSDAELVYKFATRIKSDAEAEAFSKTLDRWKAERNSDYKQLEGAHSNSDSQFQWENIWFETVHQAERVRPHELQALTGVEYTEESTVYDISQQFATEYLKATVKEIQSTQQETNLSGREFVTLVLDAAESTPEDRAHRQMDISLGNYRGKKGTVSNKLDRADKTLKIAERIRDN